MAKYVREIMNRELFAVSPGETAGHVRSYLRALGITGAPAIDDGGLAVGFISLRDVVDIPSDVHVGSLMTTPVDQISADTTIREAAQCMARRNRHHLVVVDDSGCATGFIGSLDVVRALIGEPVPHPKAFPHYDETVGLCWTDDTPLTVEGVDAAPDGPGLFRLVRSRTGHRDRVVWAEGTRNVRTRLLDLLSGPQPALRHLARELEGGTLRFRAAAAESPEEILAAAAHVGATTAGLG